jgi:hypothetical protein
MVSAQSNHAHSDSINDITSIEWLGNKTSGYNAMIVVTHKKIQQQISHITLPIGADQGTRQIFLHKIQDISGENSSLSLYPKIFDYSLGGYYHRER